jgi:hypothetical protein
MTNMQLKALKVRAYYALQLKCQQHALESGHPWTDISANRSPYRNEIASNMKKYEAQRNDSVHNVWWWVYMWMHQSNLGIYGLAYDQWSSVLRLIYTQEKFTAALRTCINGQ